MFSGFGNIFAMKPRRTESTDTRLGIRHHDPDQGSHGKRNRKTEPRPGFETDDSTTITVEALRIFLENFLRVIENEKDAARPKNLNSNIAVLYPVENRNSSSITSRDSQAARAVNAYQHTAHNTAQKIPAAPDPAEEAPSLLTAPDIDTIHKLIKDLGPLTTRGIEYITIERSDTFLGSLAAAVEKAARV
jgi:hypothetical protein